MLNFGLFEKIAKEFGTPVYVYDEKKIREQAGLLYSSLPYSPKCLLYAMKANSNPHILEILMTTEIGGGIGGIDAVSPGEIDCALKVGFGPEQIVFTGNNISEKELDEAIKKGVVINIDSLSLLEKIGKKYPGSEIFVRINIPHIGAGHHSHCITSSPESKFGIWHTETRRIKRIAKKYGLKIVGLHQHIGSQILEVKIFLRAVEALLRVAKKFPNLKFLDFGGGLGVPYKPGEKPLDVERLGKEISKRLRNFCRSYGEKLMILEPGRYLVAEAGYLLTRVNTIKKNPDGRIFAGVDTGFNHLIRPAMYGSYHEIVNISNPHGYNPHSKKEKVDIVGNLCESGDRFAVQREINHVIEGDLLVIENAGAYGYSMASNYNSRPKPAEVLVEPDGKIRLIRRRETLKDLLLKGGG
jgi:diaminopimelate decarboxylase